MLTINKISSGTVIDFAAEELKKYLRMMNPYENEIDISFNPGATDGFRLGLLADLGITETVENARYDDLLYAECDETGGVIGGINQRSVLLAVYEYLRENGLRWLYPGPDGEYIPIKKPTPVSFMIRPSCRYRGFANTTAASYQTNLEFIDFLPKIGMNTFMVECRVPVFYTDNYYTHKRNSKNRPSERATADTILQWKRGTECEAAKRGLVFHDVGHGFCVDSMGVDSNLSWYSVDESCIPEENRQYLAKINGVRGLFHGVPINTNFCMSNPVARGKVAKYVSDYAVEHKNVDLLHVWLADGCNNHCECDECLKRTPSDWYVETMNDIDAELTRRNIDVKIVFLAYVDTSWAPETARFNNPDRFVFMLAPFSRPYCNSIPKNGINTPIPDFKHNNNPMPKTLEEYLVHYLNWRKLFDGPAFSFDYHFCWCEYNDLSTLKHAKTIHDEVVYYKELGIDGIVEDGDMRGFLPHGIGYYTLARTLLDTSLSAEEIAEDYLSHVYGEAWREFRDLLVELEKIAGYSYLSRCESADPKVSPLYNPSVAEKIEKDLPRVLKKGRSLVEKYFDSTVRVHTVASRLFGHYLDLIEGFLGIIKAKAIADDKEALRLYNEFEESFGKRECEIERYFNQCFFFNSVHYHAVSTESKVEFLP